ncbi:MAG TPA: hypothetical protein VGR37_23050 [Longimicrobiaceae bacterium]|nr:hypothetical protein [Longimicrobiaceae bacterium]
MRESEGRGPDRLGGLRRFALAITALNVLGHTVLGFEPSWAHPLAALAAAYATEWLLELTDARLNGRAPRYRGGWRTKVDFLLSAHITGLAVSMLLYANERLMPVAFAAAAAIASKAVFRLPAERGGRHFFNPSNLGITLTLLCFPWIGITPPYHFTEGLDRVGDWALPALVVCTGTLLNAKFTRRLPLIGAWLAGFAAQAVVRHLVLDASLVGALFPVTGVAFILFTFYMITDPGTTPSGTAAQVAFGASVAAVYGLLMAAHVVFGIFFALTAVCAVRGVHAHALAWAARRRPEGVPVHVPVAVAVGVIPLPRPAPALLREREP